MHSACWAQLPLCRRRSRCRPAAAPRPSLQLRNRGVALGWSLMEDVKAGDPRFAATPEDVAFWAGVAALGPADPLPADLMRRFHASAYALLRCGQYADRVEAFLAAGFKREK